ncbi:biotin--[acetyl-CoA-carboxylase] ligase [Thermococcus sp.]|uniref:biotin--[acetyl-CoA-carboxylase] ligase n=1 Tax=Thermococcus sp. TaxID=35749 RepID=UPI00261C14DA|nr:biotin--[acetyl-CoA-carboxylase] ligase [Thermococcus sp.]
MEWKTIRLEEIGSTNDYARDIAQKSPEGTVVIAKRQTAGRGRKGRKWTSPEGGLWMSVILKPDKPDPRLVFVGALAVLDALAEFGIRGWIKWPNDIWVGERKIAGILTEGRAGEFVVMGIGLNVNNKIPEELGETATSMARVLGREISLEKVLSALLKALEGWYRIFKEEPLRVIEETRRRTLILGKAVKVIRDGEIISGRAADILEDGSLLLETPSGLKRIIHGDVSLRFF